MLRKQMVAILDLDASGNPIVSVSFTPNGDSTYTLQTGNKKVTTTTSPAVFSGLTIGTSYTFKMITNSNYKDTDPITIVSPITNTFKNHPDINVLATTTNNSVKVTFDTVPNATYYKILPFLVTDLSNPLDSSIALPICAIQQNTNTPYTFNLNQGNYVILVQYGNNTGVMESPSNMITI